MGNNELLTEYPFHGGGKGYSANRVTMNILIRKVVNICNRVFSEFVFSSIPVGNVQ